MQKSIVLIIILLFITSVNYSCKKKTCPAYGSDTQKEEYKLKNTKRKKAKLF